MKALVTGGAGFIGSHLVDQLIKLGHEVIIIDDLSTGKKENLNPKAQFIEADITDLGNAFRKIVASEPIDWVFHLAAAARVIPSFKDPAKYHRINIDGTYRVLELARILKAKKFIFASSSSVYGGYGPDYLPLTTDLKPLPKSPYAFQKENGERLCAMFKECYGLDYVACRFFNVYGPRMSTGQYMTVIQAFIEAWKLGKPLPLNGTGEQTRDFTHVLDVVSALIAGAQKDTNGNEILNVGSGVETSVNQIAKYFDHEVEHRPAVPNEPLCTRADISNTAWVLDWEPKYILNKDIIKQLKYENSSGKN